ncbi:MAG: hydroxymethylglutaryl-CoA lyase [Candidatus Berkiellales bacterium]
MDQIKIVEVGPRDGLQNEKNMVPTQVKLAFIEKLVAAGLKTIETTSFVSPKMVPQLADHETLMQQIPSTSGVHYSVLIPNQRGLTHALSCQVKDIAVFAAASETFSQKNIGRSIQQSLDEYALIIKQAKEKNLRVRGYVSCVLGCPYEGKVPRSQVIAVAKSLFAAGCDEISLGDTIGVGTPALASELVKNVANEIPISQLALHFHDTYGQALANILACLALGIKTIDSSVAGLGGCPYAKGATGNVATEEVVYMLSGMGIKTGIDLDKLIEAGEFICQYLRRSNQSKVAVAMLAKRT